MKHRIFTMSISSAILVLALLAAAPRFTAVHAVDCSNIPFSGNYTLTSAATSCTFPGTGVHGVDAGTGSTNTGILTIPYTGASNIQNLSVLSGQTLAMGSITITNGGSITIVTGGELKPGSPIYASDPDGDGHADPTAQSLTGTTRRNALTGGINDCGPNSAAAKPGQTVYQTGSFTNTVTGLSYDWNCNGVETRAYTRLYTCSACTNGSGYASNVAATSGTVNQDPANTGWLTTIPGCNVAATRYTVTNLTCRDPAVANCSTSITTATVTQPCL